MQEGGKIIAETIRSLPNIIKTEEKKDLFSRVNSQLIESDCRNDTLYQV